MRTRILTAILVAISVLPLLAQTATETITIDAGAPTHPFPHYWEQMFGSGRGVLSLRDAYRRDVRSVKQITGFQYVRFHGILNDEVGVYDEDKQGKSVYDFSYVDQIYDGLLALGVKPFVELSFMPYKLASDPKAVHVFWYHPNVSPPKDYAKWDDLISQFVHHLIDRYGVDEVASWYFEVWNEPNLDFWTGKPAQQTYFELYDHTARDIKAIAPSLRVGGPATAQAAWVADMIRHADEAHVPLDFVSTHVYGNDKASDIFHTNENIPRDHMVCRAVKKVHDEITASSRPRIPLIWSEYNAAYDNQVDVTDSIYMGPWLATTIAQCDGLTEMMSYWTFSDVFEEQGIVKTPFYGGFGLMAEGSIPKPSYYAMELLHRLGDRRVDNDNPDVLVTKTDTGTLTVAVWNIVNPAVNTNTPPTPAETGAAKTVKLQFKGVPPTSHVAIRRLDADNGNALGLWQKMGSPRYPTREQLEDLRQQSRLSGPDFEDLTDGTLTLELPVNGLVVLQVH
jgi:xylan 1,4-beta-xylosidase